MLVGEELGVDRDGIDEVLLIGGNGEIFAAALGDILRWARYVVFFVSVEIAKCLARAVWVEVCPDTSDGFCVDYARYQG